MAKFRIRAIPAPVRLVIECGNRNEIDEMFRNKEVREITYGPGGVRVFAIFSDDINTLNRVNNTLNLYMSQALVVFIEDRMIIVDYRLII